MYLCLHDFWLILFNVDSGWFGFTGFTFFKEISKRRQGSLVFNWFYFILKIFFVSKVLLRLQLIEISFREPGPFSSKLN